MSEAIRLPDLMLVTGVSRIDVLSARLAASPCLQRGGLPWVAHFNCDSAAMAFNATLDSRPRADCPIWKFLPVCVVKAFEPVPIASEVVEVPL